MSYSVDRAGWSNKSIFDQMGNVASEVGRAFKAQRSGKADEGLFAVVRALDLIDATAEAQLLRHPERTKEILRAREQFVDAYYQLSNNPPDAQSLENYFMHFAVAARLKAV